MLGIVYNTIEFEHEAVSDGLRIEVSSPVVLLISYMFMFLTEGQFFRVTYKYLKANFFSKIKLALFSCVKCGDVAGNLSSLMQPLGTNRIID